MENRSWNATHWPWSPPPTTLMMFSGTGAMVRYDHERRSLNIYDLNPETHLEWRMSRWGLFRLAWRCLVAGLT